MQLDSELVLVLRPLDLKETDTGDEVCLEKDVAKVAPPGGVCPSWTGSFSLDGGLALLLLPTRKVAGLISENGNSVTLPFAPMGVFGRASITPESVPRSRSW